MIKAIGIKDDNQPTLTKVEDSTGKGMLIASSKVESDYLSPRQLVQSALAGCLSITIHRELDNNGVSYRNVVVSVDMKEEAGKTKFLYQISIDSDDNMDRVNQIKIQAVENCYISGLLSQGIEMEEAEIEEKAHSCESGSCCI